MNRLYEAFQEYIWTLIAILIFALFIVFVALVMDIFRENELASVNGLILTLLKGGD